MLRDIGGRRIGPDAPIFVIAEIGLNHSGSVEWALELVDAAAEAGASAVKLQTLYADRLVAAACPAPAHVQVSSLREFFATFELDLDAHQEIVARARQHGLAVMTTPFAEDVVARTGRDWIRRLQDRQWRHHVSRLDRHGCLDRTPGGDLERHERSRRHRRRARSGARGRQQRTRGSSLRVRVSGPVRIREPACDRDARGRVPPARWPLRSR